MQYTYRPILRWKAGERAALEHLSSHAKSRTNPVIHLLPKQFKGRKETQSRGAIAPEQNIAQQLAQEWGAGEFAFNASALSSYADGSHPIWHIATECANNGLRLVPALSLADFGSPYYNACLAITQTYPAGAVLQINLDEFSDVANWAGSWPCPIEMTDLVVDLQTQVHNALSMSHAAAMTFQQLHRGPDWRSVAIAGTSMPDDFSNQVAAGTHWIRREMPNLWHSVVSSGLPYRLHYGDYATVSVRLPPEDQFLRPRITARYTTPSDFMICRGYQNSGRGGVDQGKQFRGHATTIASNPQRYRLNCWSDDVIDEIASEETSPGGFSQWVSYGVNRHIERVCTDLP